MVPVFSLGKCKTRAGYSAKLKKKQKLELTEIKKQFEVILETPILLVVREEGLEIIVHGYGELLFKKGDDVSLMEKIAKKIYSAGIRD